jgi:peptidyl-tRNA hydrolase
MKHKMYCIYAKESVDKMKGSRGKLASQAGHAYLHAFWNANYSKDIILREQANNYRKSERAYKITLIVDTTEELKLLHKKYKKICGTALIEDAGFTVFNEPTITCLGIGPINEQNIGEDLRSLKVFL